MNTDEQMTVLADKTLSERLKRAYERVSVQLRPEARKAFCEVHKISEGYFRGKRSGFRQTTEQECEWMEAYSPYKSN